MIAIKKISVIIPVYATEKYLEKCLNSVIQQTFNNFEIIIIYKQSKDNSLKLIKKFMAKDKRIKLFLQDKGGLGGARNIGIEKSVGDYIFFLDSDDWICSQAFELLLNKIEKDNSDMVMFPFYSYDESKQKIVKDAWGSNLNFSKKFIGKTFSCNNLTPKEFISENAIVVAWNKLYRRSFLEKHKIRFPENLRYEDNPFYYKSIILANSISIIDQKLLYYRINRSNSLQASNYDNQNVLDIVKIMKIIEKDIIDNKLPAEFYQQFENYMYNEFLWRLNLLEKHKLLFLEMIKSNFKENQFYNLLKKMNYKLDVKEHEITTENKISIIIPVYNVEKYIAFCLNSLLNQTLSEIEIIIVNDCSTDNSNNIMVNYALFDKRIKILYNEKNMGAGFSRNVGLKNASGKYIMFLDPDDLYYSDDTLMNLYKIISKYHMHVVCGNIGVIPDNFESNHIVTKYNGYNIKEEKKLNFEQYDVWPSWGFTRFIYEKEFLVKEKICFPNYRNYEDPIFLATVLLKAKEFYGIPDIIYLYRQTNKPKVITLNKIKDTLKSIKKLLKLYKSNNLPTHYAFEYQHFINYVISDIKPYVKRKKSEYKEIQNEVNSILSNADISLLNLDKTKIYKNINKIKRTNIIKRSYLYFIRVIKRIYHYLWRK